MSKQDYERLELAINCMMSYNVCNHEYVSRHNVLLLLKSYIEEDKEEDE